MCGINPPLEPQMKWHFVQGSMESHYFESRSASPPPPPPHFEKSGYILADAKITFSVRGGQSNKTLSSRD